MVVKGNSGSKSEYRRSNSLLNTFNLMYLALSPSCGKKCQCNKSFTLPSKKSIKNALIVCIVQNAIPTFRLKGTLGIDDTRCAQIEHESLGEPTQNSEIRLP